MQGVGRIKPSPFRFAATPLRPVVFQPAEDVVFPTVKEAEGLVQHLSSLVGSNVEVTLEIHADVPQGVPDQAVRTITENCRVLKFKTHGFEKE